MFLGDTMNNSCAILKGLVRLAIFAAGVWLVFSAPVLADEPGPDGGFYYFSDGARIDLEPSDGWIAVRFRDRESKRLQSVVPEAINLAERRDLVRNRLTLLPVRDEMTLAKSHDLMTDLAAMPEVELVAPVFRAEGALMIVTDEFVVRFRDGISEEQLNRINQNHGVRIVRKLLRSDTTYVLRVLDGNALDVANAYHGLAEVVFAHPDFVRVMDPQPNDLASGDHRVILAPDGSVLPPDTVIEKGRNDLMIVEPASATLPSSARGSTSKAAPSSVTRVQIETEGFEVDFPGDWTLYGNPSWGDVSYRSYSGSKSAYSVGSSVSPPGPYPYDANSWLVYGPFDLSDAEDAQVNLQAWINTESGYDFFRVLVFQWL